ncbi:MAG: tetratricopeptide repeat protein [Bacteroidia bacterium]
MTVKFLLVLLLLTVHSFGQSQKIDSFFQVWEDPDKSDSIRVDALRYCLAYLSNSLTPDSFKTLANELIDFSKENNYLRGVPMGYAFLGNMNTQQGNFKDAISNYNEGINAYQQLEHNEGMAFSYLQLGKLYMQQGNLNLAIESYKLSRDFYLDLENDNGISDVYANMGIMYRDFGYYSEALKQFKTLLSRSQKSESKLAIAVALANIGSVYEYQKDHENAINYYNQAVSLTKKAGNEYLAASVLERIGWAYQALGDYNKALKLYESSHDYYEASNFLKDLALSKMRIGVLHGLTGEYEMGINWLTESNIIALQIGDQKRMDEIELQFGIVYQLNGENETAIENCEKSLTKYDNIGMLPNKKLACQCLFDAHKALGEGNKALEYLQMVNEIDDNLKSEETAKKLQLMEFQKQVEADSIANAEKEREVHLAHEAELRKKNQTRNYLIIGAFVLVILAGGLFARVRYIRKSKVALQKEKDRSEDLLLNILPEEIAQELKEKGKADARDFDQVTILFTDFKEFTQASEKLSAKELVAEINTCFEAFDVICEKYGVEKIKTIGDSYMAAGGLPVSTDNSVRNTVLAALEMQEFITTRSAQLHTHSSFQMRAGIHTGPVVAGIVGVKKFQYDIWGDTVNTASRMESHGEIGKVNISEATHEALKTDDTFSFENRGMIDVKGKGEVKMYFVIKREFE